ncbi:MAG: hypothetical protein M3346_03475 [Actinomycetota bacterium]|nr:hypothetical protein [Actinomycetota bacterium]
MKSDLRRQLERTVPDSEIPPLALEKIKSTGRHLLWRRRAVIAACSLASMIAAGGTVTVMINSDDAGSIVGPSGPSTPEESKEIPPDPVVSLTPDRVTVGERAELAVHRAPGDYGLDWIFERREGSSWEWIGYLEAGPGNAWKEVFHLAPLSGGDVEDIGFTKPAVMTIKMPQLEPAEYRLGMDFVQRGSGSEGIEWHYAEFEVLP